MKFLMNQTMRTQILDWLGNQGWVFSFPAQIAGS
jgi:hypothetical protein